MVVTALALFLAQDATPAVRLDTGTRIPLSLLNSVSTKNSVEGDRVYLETVFPILSGGRIVVPVGSSVAGTVTSVKRAGRVKGRAELFVRFDSLILPNGTMRDFRARIGQLDSTSPGKLDRGEGKIEGEGNKSGDAKVLAETATAGAVLGGITGAARGSAGAGLGIGAAAGATAAMIGILATRGPDAILQKGTTVEMVIDRPLTFEEREIDFSNAPAARRPSSTVAPTIERKGETPGFRRVTGTNPSN